MVELAVKVENLVKHYSGTIAVDGISFAVGRGVTAALLGGNGAGKTTTLSILLGLLLPTAGQVQVLGEDMLRHRYRVLPRMNFSSPFVDLPHRLTVRQNLLIYARRPAEPRRTHQAPSLQIGEFLERPAGKLSAGQRPVALAKALLNERAAAARRADRFARPGYRRLGAQLSRRLRARTGATI
jgi:ABC-2 type transport system ATP-binding protein